MGGLMSGVSVNNPRCEYLVNPSAIDTPAPRLSWEIAAPGRGVTQTAYQVLVAGSRKALDAGKGDLWDSGKLASDQCNQIEYAGARLASGQQAFWKVRVWTSDGHDASSEPAMWGMGLLQASDWTAKWIADPAPIPTPRPALPSPVLRNEFAVDKKVKRAIVAVSALGYYELRINGLKVGDQLLAPEWTDYHTRVQYQTYDVTGLLKRGANAVGAMLADGWYAGRIGISHIVEGGPLRGFYGEKPALLMQMDIEFTDGTKQRVISDATWKVTTDGPVRKSCILDGEVYDARKETAGWDQPGFSATGWAAAQEIEAPKIALVPQMNEPVRVTEEIKPKAVTEPKPGVYVFDLGQNMAGVCRLNVRAKAGQTITLRHAEVLDKDGMIYRDNLRMKPLGGELGARQEDQYIARGEGTEGWEPAFTYHGFRYVEVTGLEAKPSADLLTGRVFHSAPRMTGQFECSSQLLNTLMHNIVWTHRDNMHSIPTDCPQRDERLGWMGDMLVFAQPAAFNMDMAAFFTKWIRDIRDDQAKDGRYPDFAPHPFDVDKRFSGVAAWGDAGVVVPWRIYVNYGDKRALAEHFESARHWVDYVHSKNPDLLWKNSRGNDYGDWLNGDTLKLEGFPKGEAEVPKEVFATAFFQHSTELVARMAEVLGRPEAAQYRKLADDIKAAFQKAYIESDGKVKGHTQSAYALVLNFNLAPENLRANMVERMVERVHGYKNHISTGFHTTVMLMNQLSAAGREDVAYMLINNRTIPSWGYTIDQGATTIWERWDGYVEGRGFQDPGMNSFCHYAIGSVGEWMYRHILGINPDESRPGYSHVILRPQPGGGLTWAKGGYESIRGPIASEWKLDGADLRYSVTIPANTTATLYLPAASVAAVTEGGKPVGEAAAVQSKGLQGRTAVLELGSGTYRFVSRGVPLAENR